MGPEALGIIGFAGGFIGAFSLLTDPGLNVTHIKRIGEGKDLAKCNGAYFMMKVWRILYDERCANICNCYSSFYWNTGI